MIGAPQQKGQGRHSREKEVAAAGNGVACLRTTRSAFSLKQDMCRRFRQPRGILGAASAQPSSSDFLQLARTPGETSAQDLLVRIGFLPLGALQSLAVVGGLS